MIDNINHLILSFCVLVIVLTSGGVCSFFLGSPNFKIGLLLCEIAGITI